MQDHELYRRILGIEAPWFVDSVDLKLEAGEIHVYLQHHEMINWPCPECRAGCKLYDPGGDDGHVGPYIASVREHVPEANGKIVFDKFHVAKHLGEAVDKVRRKEHKTLKAAGDDRLTGTRYDWLRNPAKMEPKDRKEFAELRNSELKTARAWALKETAVALYDYVYERPARKHFRWWHGWAVRSRLSPMTEVARMLKRRLENIITYVRYRITNASSESINAKIQWVKYTARGFRNRQNFVHAIYFHCGGLDMASTILSMPNS